jgi:hypothetical protein
MALDPRLADSTVLIMAAMPAKRHQVTAPRQTVVLKVVYDGTPWGDPPEEGPSYTYTLPPQPGGTP